MLTSLYSWVKSWLLLDDTVQVHPSIENWRISSLRIMLLTGFLLSGIVVADSTRVAYFLNLTHIIVITFSFYTAMGLQLFFSQRYYHGVSVALLITIISAGLTIHLFVPNPQLVVLGTIFFYALPMVALILLGIKYSIFFMFVNVIPFYMSVTKFSVYDYIPFDIALNNTHWYLHSLVFLFFNVCIPLSAARTISAAAKLGEQRKFKNEAILMHLDLYRSLFVNSSLAYFIVERNGRIVDTNQVARLMFTLNKEALVDGLLLSQVAPELNLEHSQGVLNFKQKKTLRVIRYNVRTMERKDYCMVSFEDVSQQIAMAKQLEDKLKSSKKMKMLDDCSGLPNSIWFGQTLEQLFKRYPTGMCVVVVEIVNIQYIQQKFSKDALHLAIRALANNLQHSALAPMAISRVSECRVAYISNDGNSVSLQRSINQHHQSLCNSFLFGLQRVYLEARCGIAVVPKHGKVAKELLNAATYAAANALPKFSRVYEQQKMAQFLERQEIADLLTEVLKIDQQQLYLDYQAKVNDKGQLMGVEALLRWRSPIIGSVPPGLFISIAEERGIIIEVTRWVVLAACKQVRLWLDKGLEPVPVAINLSAIDLEQDDFISFLLNSLTQYKISPKYIELELTESALGMSSEKTSELIDVLLNWGFAITIDDFGRGYSNLSRLIQFPVTRLKIDRQFVTNIHIDEKHAQMVKTIIAMCESLNIQVLAEGTELCAQLDRLKALGCRQFQGFGFAKPCKPEQIEPWLQTEEVLLPFREIRSSMLS